MSDNVTNFDIRFKTTADLAAAEEVKKAVDDVKASTEDTSKAQQEQQDVSDELGGSLEGLAGKLRGMAAAGGAATLAAAVLKQGFDAWLQRDPELQSSFTNLSNQISSVSTDMFASWFETWIMSAETGKSVLDGLTVALGGQTEEMRNAAQPLSGYATLSDEAAQRADAFTQSLKDQTEAARKAAEALEHELEMLKARNAILEAEDKNATAQKMRELEASDMPPDEKARKKAEINAEAAAADFKRREEERAKQGDVERGKAEILEREARASEKQAAELQRRKAEIQTREGLSTAVIPAKEQDLRAAQERYSSMTAEGPISPADAARMQKEIADAKAALEKAKADRDAIAPGDAAETAKNAEKARADAIAARKSADEARTAANRGGALRSAESQADAARTQGSIDEIMWRGDAEAATASRQMQDKAAREQKRQEAEAAREQKRQQRGAAQLLPSGPGGADVYTGNAAGPASGDIQRLGNTVASHGGIAAQGLQNSGLGAAADKLMQSTQNLQGDATAAEAAKAASAIASLAPLVSQMSAQTRAQLSRLTQEVETLKKQLANTTR